MSSDLTNKIFSAKEQKCQYFPQFLDMNIFDILYVFCITLD